MCFKEKRFDRTIYDDIWLNCNRKDFLQSGQYTKVIRRVLSQSLLSSKSRHLLANNLEFMLTYLSMRSKTSCDLTTIGSNRFQESINGIWAETPTASAHVLLYFNFIQDACYWKRRWKGRDILGRSGILRWESVNTFRTLCKQGYISRSNE